MIPTYEPCLSVEQNESKLYDNSFCDSVYPPNAAPVNFCSASELRIKTTCGTRTTFAHSLTCDALMFSSPVTFNWAGHWLITQSLIRLPSLAIAIDVAGITISVSLPFGVRAALIITPFQKFDTWNESPVSDLSKWLVLPVPN
ncbi:hypothetical protein AX774_g2229 [Zancudomyces culisetae]|uniref:Uncharacterized protein n=1 Tax=Zancudomyces culisetae TaxID=1213189 RepID=A0A1R1PTI5_ZANCU|nr:hypothetical protein AX774_g2229 [Zancudomyces culisetae]|eukprot:OMH84254.1 hypothetical protein AX774_g2229 [Zancudomyces culisetae]